ANIFLLLVADIFPDLALIAAYSRHEIAPGPETFPQEIAAPPPIRASNVNSALTLKIAHDACHRILGRNTQQHMDMIGLQVPFFDATVLLPGQFPEDRAQFFAQRIEQHLAAVLRDKDHVVFAFPEGMLYAFILVHW